MIIAGEKPNNTRQYIAAFCASLGAMSVGTVLGYASPAMYQLREKEVLNSTFFNSSDVTTSTTNHELTLSTNELSWFSAAFSIGALIGGLICSPLMKTFGRRGTILVSVIPSSIGWLMLGFGVNFTMLLIGRIFTGVTAGIACAVTPVYLGEIASPNVRGILGASFQLNLSLGIAYAFIFGSFLRWYHLAFVCWIPSLASCLLMVFQPESPIFYVQKGKFNAAKRAFQILRGNYVDISEEYEACVKSNDEAGKQKAEMKDIMEPRYYKPVLIVLVLVALQQFVGINALTFNLATIFEKTGSGLSENMSSIICALVMSVSVIPAGMLVESAGRKKLLLSSAALMGLAQGLLGLYFYLLETAEDFTVIKLAWLPIVSVIIFMFGFSLGFGSVPWILLGEMFPISIRESASAVAIAFNWGASFGVIYSFESLMVALSTYGFFWYFAAWCLLAFLFTLFFVQETKGKSLEEISNLFGRKS